MPTVTNTTADLEGDTLVTTQDAQTITGLKTYSRGANTPFAVAAGSTKVANLDADLLDGLEAAAFAELSAAETITGLWSFSRGAAPPFAVNVGATMVANLDADKVDGYEAAAFAALSEAETITGAWTFNTAPKLANTVALNARNAANSADVALLKLTAGDVFEIGQASLAASLLGGQLKFPATQNASADANTLDDCEEGTWTVIIGGAGGTSGQTYAAQAGSYRKIGSAVFFTAYAALSAKGTITGNVIIGTLPFTAAGVSSQFAGGFMIWFSSLATSWIALNAYISPSGTTMLLQGNTAAAGSNNSNLGTADIGNSTAMMTSGWYPAAA